MHYDDTEQTPATRFVTEFPYNLCRRRLWIQVIYSIVCLLCEALKNFNYFTLFFSTWTIDLCYLLKRYKIRHIYTTTTIGINPKFRDTQYFGPILWHDHVRVSEKFASATEKGITIHKKAVNNVDLLTHLAFNGPIIALINNYLLHCEHCHGEKAGALIKIG